MHIVLLHFVQTHLINSINLIDLIISDNFAIIIILRNKAKII